MNTYIDDVIRTTDEMSIEIRINNTHKGKEIIRPVETLIEAFEYLSPFIVGPENIDLDFEDFVLQFVTITTDGSLGRARLPIITTEEFGIGFTITLS